MQIVQLEDSKVFEQLFKMYYKKLCFYGMKFLPETQQVEEVVQDVFYGIWEKRAELKVDVSIQSYLYRAVHNSCLNVLKHEKIKQGYREHFSRATKEDISYYSEETVDHDLHSQINAAIEKLPPERKAIFKLSRFEDLKYKEIAEKQGISIKTVEAQMGKALQFLREELKDYALLICLLMGDWLNIFLHG